MMYTPRQPVRRRLNFTPYRSVKRARTATTTAGFKTFRRFNRRTITGVSTAGTLVQQVRNLQAAVKALAPEVKYVDVTLDDSFTPAAGLVKHATAIGQGDTQATRTGNTICVKNISAEGAFVRAITDPSVPADVRFIVVVDKKQVADTAPSIGQVMEYSTAPYMSFPAVANLERFRILYMSPPIDLWRAVIDSNNLATNAPTQSHYFKFSKAMNLKVSYNGTAATDIEKNGIYVMFISSNTSATGVVGYSRVAFTDV